PFDPVINGRLTGLTLNSNFLASVLLATFCFIYVFLLTAPRQRAWPGWLLLAIVYSGVAQTVSKGPILACFAALAATTCGLLLFHGRALAWRTVGIGAFCAFLVMINVVLPPLVPAARAFAERTYAEWTKPVSTPARGAEVSRPPSVPSATSALERK